MSNSFFDELSRQFWIRRIKKEYKKCGLKQTVKKQTLDLADENATEEYIWSFIDAVKKGIGDSVPKECLKNMFQKAEHTESIDLTGFVDLLSEREYKSGKAKIVCSFSLGIKDGTIRLCCITNDEITFGNYLKMKNLVCENPEQIGKAMAGLYQTSDDDINRCEIEIAKVNKVKQMVGVGLETVLKKYFKDSDLQWEMHELRDGRFIVRVKLETDLILRVFVDPQKFENDFAGIINIIDVWISLVCKKIKGLKIPDNPQGVICRFYE